LPYVFSSSCHGEGKHQFWNPLQRTQFSTIPHCGQCPFSTKSPRRTVYPSGNRLAMARLAKLSWRGCRTGLSHKRIPPDTLLAPPGL
jgi:hypothetical protein